MSMNGINGDLSKALEALKTDSAKEGGKIQQSPKKIQIKMNKFEGGDAQRKVTQEIIDKALNEPSSHKALKLLLANSPVGFGNQSSSVELENLGYLDTGMRQYHLGAPVEYASKDGGSVKVYDQGLIGNDGKLHTDAGSRTTVYKNGNFEQTMIYDENGKLTGGKIVIKDQVAGFTERQIDFTVAPDGKITTFE